MQRQWAATLAIFLLAGCRESNPNLHVEQSSADSVRQTTAAETASETVKDMGDKMKIVTGEPATKDDKKEENTEPLKDKPGAVAVKMQY